MFSHKVMYVLFAELVLLFGGFIFITGKMDPEDMHGKNKSVNLQPAIEKRDTSNHILFRYRNDIPIPGDKSCK